MRRVGLEYLNGPTKRRLDIVGALLIAGASLPVGAGAAAAVAIDQRTWNPFFRQTRVGKGGKPLDILKFRTLPLAEPDSELQTFGAFDPRASRVGQFLRSSTIDEWPQLVNVLIGEQSLVGIRDRLDEDIDHLKAIEPKKFPEWYDSYIGTPGGLTGLAQIDRHGYRVLTDEVLRRSMQLEIDYTRQASLAYDLRILGATPLRLLQAKLNVIENGPSPDLQTSLSELTTNVV